MSTIRKVIAVCAVAGAIDSRTSNSERRDCAAFARPDSAEPGISDADENFLPVHPQTGEPEDEQREAGLDHRAVDAVENAGTKMRF